MLKSIRDFHSIKCIPPTSPTCFETFSTSDANYKIVSRSITCHVRAASEPCFSVDSGNEIKSERSKKRDQREIKEVNSM